jgi:NAD(P)-dependent dehydrogenase (short-subunit alcohol dehydrogenase family)
MSNTILITGANRGLGLEFVRQYAFDGNTILACTRAPNDAKDLLALQKEHKNIQVFQLDITSATDIAALKKQLTQPIDIMINNAGMLEKDPPLGNLSIESLTKTFLVNAVAPLKMAEAFSEHLAKSQRKLLVSVSSSMGSITENSSGGYYSYRGGKAALNMFMKSAGHDLAQHGIQVLLLHPGWVKTRMGGNDAMIEPEQSITGMRNVIATYNPAPGEVLFYRYNGEVVPW